MLPTPDTSHVSYSRVYEPAEDSFLLLDTLPSASEVAFLKARFSSTSSQHDNPTPSSATATANTHTPSLSPVTPPLILEVGTGSGVVLAFLTAHAETFFGHPHVLTIGVDVNSFACAATAATVKKTVASVSSEAGSGLFLDTVRGDLVNPVRAGQVDVLVFNPPYVPTPELPSLPAWDDGNGVDGTRKPLSSATTTFEEESHLLELSYAGGKDGMETTDRLIDSLPNVLSERGCAYVLLCAQNKPEEVKTRIRGFGQEWRAETVGRSGKVGGWEKLQIIRIWREVSGERAVMSGP